MWTAGKTRLGCRDHYVVDGEKRRIILAALVTPADVMDNQPMLDLLWRVRFRRRGLENVNIEGLLIAAGQSLKRWLAATGWGRRHTPCGSLVVLLRETGRFDTVSS